MYKLEHGIFVSKLYIQYSNTGFMGMNWENNIFITIVVIFTILIFSCKKSTGSEIDWGSADFTSFVTIGNSLTAGVSDGALYEVAQKNSFPNLIAQAAEVEDFEQPIMGGYGFSFEEEEGRISLNFFVDPPSIGFYPSGTEDNKDLNRAYNNLGIPLIRANQVYTATTSIEADSNHFVDKILRNSGRTQIEEALSLDPTLLTLWIGNNDVLEAASLGLADDNYPYTEPEDFETDLTNIINELTNGTDSPILIANIFDLTDLPYFTSLPSKMTFKGDSKYLYGVCENDAVRQLTDDDLILFWAIPDYLSLKDSTQFPGNISENTALNDTLILDIEEKSEIQGIIRDYNDIIEDIANSNSQLYLVDIYSLFKEIAQNGYDIGGINYTNDLISFDEQGVLSINLLTTLFSYDGLHPNQYGYISIANAFIEEINSKFDAGIPLVD